MTKYTPVQKAKIKAGLIRYYFEKGQSWIRVHYDMRCTLGLKDLDKRLHERDPRNFCVDGIEASEPKLELFADFLKKVYGKNFDLSDGEDNTAQIGLTLAGFSIGHEASADKIYAKSAFEIASELFVSKTYHGNDSDFSGIWVQLALCTAQKKNPFLRFVQATVRIAETDMEAEKALEIIHEEIMSGTENPRSRIINLHKGVLCPVKINEDVAVYSGLCSTPNHVPVHLYLSYSSKNGALMMNQLFDPLIPSRVTQFNTAESAYQNIRHFLTTLPDNLS